MDEDRAPVVRNRIPSNGVTKTEVMSVMYIGTTDGIAVKEFTWNAQARIIGTQPRLHHLYRRLRDHFTGAPL